MSVLEKLRSGEYKIDNLHIIDEAHARLLEVGGVKLRLLGLGGAVVMHKLFDNGEGRTTIAGGQGTMWTTLLQMGELVDTANRVYDPTETRIFVTHASPTREGILNQLAVTLKADFSISAGLHFRYGSSYNEFSVNPTLDHYRGKLAASKASFNDVWETVKHEVEPAVSENESQQRLLSYAIDVVNKMPSGANGGNPFGGAQAAAGNGQVDESAFKNMWNFNLADAAFGWLVLDIDQGRIGTEMRAQGFNFSHRGGKAVPRGAAAPVSATTGSVTPTGMGGPPPPAQTGVQRAQAQPTPPTASQVLSQPGAQNPMTRPPPSGPSAPGAPEPQTKLPIHQQQGGASPAPSKPTGTPQHTAANGSTAPSTDKAIPSEVKPNGTVPAESPRQEPAKPSQAIYIPALSGVDSEDDMRKQVFSEDDNKKITRVEKTQKGFWIVHFESPEVMQEVLKRSPAKEGRFASLKLSEFRSTRGGRAGGFAGGWGSSRGGPAGAGPQQGGYRSAGASDSEGGRGGARGGRGAFRARGSDRGRGRGRGAGRGDGGSAPTGSTPGPAATGGDA